MDNHLVSIIIPAYNAAKWIEETLQSVRHQSCTNWECIIVNDGSTDETVSVVNNFIKEDSRFHLIEQNNRGLAATRNRGIEMAGGQWIQFLDADDILEKDKLLLQLKEAGGNTEHTVIYCDYRFGEQNDIRKERPGYLNCKFKTANYFKELVLNWEKDLSIPCHCFLFSSDFFKKQGIRFDEKLLNHEDLDCWLSVFAAGPNVFFVDKVLCRYRMSNHSMSANMQKMLQGYLQVIEKHQTKNYSPEQLGWFNERRNHLLFYYRQFGAMNVQYQLKFLPGIAGYYLKRIFQKIKPSVFYAV